MAIKLVATDMDGTFLRPDNDYDRERFLRVYRRMQDAGCRFVVASGNQYDQVKTFFPGLEDEIAYAVCNGTYVRDSGELVKTFSMDPSVLSKALEVVRSLEGIDALMVGERAAYADRGCDPAFVEDLAQYFYNMERVHDLSEVDDGVLMFSCKVDEERADAAMAAFSDALGGALIPVASGEGYFDLLVPGTNKACGLSVLMGRWGITPEEVCAFGDSFNDIEMLEMAGSGFAMSGAPDEVVAAAGNVAPSNGDSGVLQVLESLFPEG